MDCIENNKRDAYSEVFEDHTNVIDYIINLPDNTKYTAAQVSKLYNNMTVSKVRYYMKMFEPILDLDYSNKMRRFTKNSLIHFDSIIKLRSDGMTIQQISDHYNNKDCLEEVSRINTINQLTIEMLAKAISIRLEDMMNNLKDMIVKDIIYEIKEINDDLKEDIITTVDELVSEKLQPIDGIEKTLSEGISSINEILTNKNYNMDLYIDKIQNKLDAFERQQENIYKSTISILDDYTPKEANKKLSLLNIKHKVK